jgi:hypothetical protein
VVTGNLDVTRGGDSPLALEVVASGALARAVELNATLRAQSSAADASLVYAPFEPQSITRAEARLRAVDLRHLVPSAPEAIFDGRSRRVESGELRGDVRVSNRVPGTVDSGRVPIASFAARIGAVADAFTLDAVNVDLGDAGKMSGRGRVSADDVAFELGGEQLNMRGAHTALEPTRFAAAIRTRGDFASQDIHATFTQPAYRVTFDGTVAADAITVRRARVAVGDGFAEAKGSVGLEPNIDSISTRRCRASILASRQVPAREPQRASTRREASSRLFSARRDRRRAEQGIRSSDDGQRQWRSRGTDDPRIEIAGNAAIGETRIAVNGRLVNPQDLRSLDLVLDLSAATSPSFTRSADCLPTDARIPGQRPSAIRRSRVDFKRFSGTVGRSDLAGNFVVDRRAAKPFMRADLTSQRLDMRDLAVSWVQRSRASNPPGRVLPHSEYRSTS